MPYNSLKYPFGKNVFFVVFLMIFGFLKTSKRLKNYQKNNELPENCQKIIQIPFFAKKSTNFQLIMLFCVRNILRWISDCSLSIIAIKSTVIHSVA